LAARGIEIEHDLTQEQRDEAAYCSIKGWNMVPSPSGAAWASLGPVTERRKRGEPEPSPEEVAERRKILAETGLDPDAVRRPGAANSPRTK